MVNHVYIHIPFCIRKCNYCSFVSGFSPKYTSLLSPFDIEVILNNFNISKNCEITLEVNPETVEYNKFKQFRALGINRISLGVQTFNDSLLKLLGRLHTQFDIISSLDIIHDAGFDNVSIDFLYGIPNQNEKLLEFDIKKALNLDVTHISTYGLKIEKNSFFYTHPPKNLPDDDIQANMFTLICKLLRNNNFEHYEISNFSKSGFNSRHNLCYWRNENYYGFGVNASGYENNIRYKNVSDIKKYMENPILRDEEIILTNNQISEDEIMLALRLKDGIDIEKFNDKFKIDFLKKYKPVIEKYCRLNLMKLDNNHLKLTEEGILLSNEILCEFIS